ncbi:hypothetical protein NIES25_21900 [Nostoc linckia NIES-25]|nr:hypothetical protein NIES25_21900 [Nostoc linckia NIES-25]
MPHINSSRVTHYQAQTQLVSLFPENPLIFLFIVATEELGDRGMWEADGRNKQKRQLNKCPMPDARCSMPLISFSLPISQVL